MKEVSKKISQKSLDIINYYVSHPSCTYQEVGSIFGVSRERVRQIIHRHKVSSRNDLMKRYAMRRNERYENVAKMIDGVVGNDAVLFNIEIQERLKAQGKSAYHRDINRYMKENGIITPHAVRHKQIADLLRTTDMSYTQIAKKCGCVVTYVEKVNRADRIRKPRKSRYSAIEFY